MKSPIIALFAVATRAVCSLVPVLRDVTFQSEDLPFPTTILEIEEVAQILCLALDGMTRHCGDCGYHHLIGSDKPK